jgi:hypothetical protein
MKSSPLFASFLLVACSEQPPIIEPPLEPPPFAAALAVVYIDWDDAQQKGFYALRDPNKEDSVRLAETENGVAPEEQLAVAADGDTLGFLAWEFERNAWTVQTLRLSDRAHQTLAVTDGGASQGGLAFSPDGTWLTYLSFDGMSSVWDLHRVRLDGTGDEILAKIVVQDFDQVSCIQPRWSRDGGTLYYSGFGDDGSQGIVYAIDLSSAETNVLDHSTGPAPRAERCPRTRAIAWPWWSSRMRSTSGSSRWCRSWGTRAPR